MNKYDIIGASGGFLIGIVIGWNVASWIDAKLSKMRFKKALKDNVKVMSNVLKEEANERE